MKDIYAVRKPNHKAWEKYLPNHPLIHTFRYGKDPKGRKIADLFHMEHIGDEHDIRKIDAEFRSFFNDVGFVYLRMTKSPFGFVGEGEEKQT